MAASPDITSGTPDWAGLAQFAKLVWPDATKSSKGPDVRPLTPMHAHGQTPTQMAGMNAGPLPFQNGVVPGPYGQNTGPYSLPQGGFSDGSPMQPGNKMTSPTMGIPGANNNQPMTADHFTTGTPNLFGNR